MATPAHAGKRRHSRDRLRHDSNFASRGSICIPRTIRVAAINWGWSADCRHVAAVHKMRCCFVCECSLCLLIRNNLPSVITKLVSVFKSTSSDCYSCSVEEN